MRKKMRNVLITEFWVRIYANGMIDWDGVDAFMWWLMHRKPKEGFLPYTRKINAFPNIVAKKS